MKKAMNTVKVTLSNITKIFSQLVWWLFHIALPFILLALFVDLSLFVLYSPFEAHSSNVTSTSIINLIKEQVSSLPLKEIGLECLTTACLLCIFLLVLYIVMVLAQQSFHPTAIDIVISDMESVCDESTIRPFFFILNVLVLIIVLLIRIPMFLQSI